MFFFMFTSSHLKQKVKNSRGKDNITIRSFIDLELTRRRRLTNPAMVVTKKKSSTAVHRLTIHRPGDPAVIPGRVVDKDRTIEKIQFQP